MFIKLFSYWLLSGDCDLEFDYCLLLAFLFSKKFGYLIFTGYYLMIVIWDLIIVFYWHSPSAQ
jgi:hypothetical protein